VIQLQHETSLNKLAERRILVTGGAGFLGSEVVRQLSLLGAHVTIVDNLSSGKPEYINNLENVRLLKGDIRDLDLVAKVVKDHDLLIHMAALPFIPDSYHYPEDFFGVNVMGTVTVVWEAIKAEVVERLVHVSSSEVYGTAKYVPMDEKHPTLPHSTYAVSKLAADRAVFTLHKEHSFPVVLVRPFNSYGPNITQPYIIPEIALQLMYGNGYIRLGNVESVRDFTYMADTAKGIIKTLLTKQVIGEVINLGSGQGIKIGDLAFLLAKIAGKKVALEVDSSRFRPYDVEKLVCDNKKALRLLNWKPEVSLEEGLRRTLEWISRNTIRFKAPFKGWSAAYRQNMTY